MTLLDRLFTRIEADHRCEPSWDPSAIDVFAHRGGYSLPEDLVTFYRRFNTVELFPHQKFGPIYRFVPVAQIRPTKFDIYGSNAGDSGPDHWLTICDVQDGNYIAIDVSRGSANQFPFIDCFHETFGEPGESRIIAMSFTELLERALSGRRGLFYLQSGFASYGDARPLTAENASRRIDGPRAPRKGWLVKFTIPGALRCYHRFFADADYGGAADAFDAARRYVEESKP